MDKKSMLNSMISHYTDGNKSQFAKMLGISPQGLSTWIARGTFDQEIIYSHCERINAAWILSGNGDMIIPEEPVEEQGMALKGLRESYGSYEYPSTDDMTSVPTRIFNVLENQLEEKDKQIESLIAAINSK